MDKLTDRPAGKRTNKPTDERMTVEREREREGGGRGGKEREGEREGERDRKSKELELYQKNRACGFSIIQENSMFSLFT